MNGHDVGFILCMHGLLNFTYENYMKISSKHSNWYDNGLFYKFWPKALVGTFKNWIIVLNVIKNGCNVEGCNVEGFDVFSNLIALAFIIYVEF